MLNRWLSIAAAILCFGMAGNAGVLYDIDFSQFSPGTGYTAASGPPNDFSSYSSNSGAFATSSYIQDSFPGLTQQPLVNVSANASTFGIFSMFMGDISSNVVTLDMQLALDSTANAEIWFNQITGAPGFPEYSIRLIFGANSNMNPDANVVWASSWNGSVPTPNYSYQTTFSREEVQNIHLVVNGFTDTFDVTVNGVSLGLNVPIGPHPAINNVWIELGDIFTQGAAGQAGIDNILLEASPIPEPSSFMLTVIGLVLFGKHCFASRLGRAQL